MSENLIMKQSIALVNLYKRLAVFRAIKAEDPSNALMRYQIADTVIQIKHGEISRRANIELLTRLNDSYHSIAS